MVSFPLFSSSQISNDPVHNKIPGKSDPCPQGSKLGNFRLMNFTYAHMLLPEPRSFHRTKICCTASRPRLITRRSIISAGSSLKTSSGVFKGKSCEESSPTENDKDSPSEGISSLAGGIVALGKFDALHIGHRELAIQAAKIGVPFLLSFIGMAEILGWEPRAPIVAKCDRKRVLSSWAPFCSNVIPKEFHIEFSKVRHLTPQQFVEKLSKELGVGGVVAGQNYRFGYRAAGDSSDLVQLCQEYGMEAFIVHSVMDMKNQQEAKDIIGCKNSTEQGQVSSTRIRHALGIGDVDYVSELLGRHHRLILMVHKSKQESLQDGNKLSAPRSCLLNIPPKGGLYEKCSLVMGDDNVLVPCRVVIDATDIHVEFDQLDPHMTITAQSFEFLGIDFGYSRV